MTGEDGFSKLERDVIGLIANKLGREPDEFKREVIFSDLRLDSLDIIDAINALEQKYVLEIDPNAGMESDFTIGGFLKEFNKAYKRAYPDYELLLNKGDF